MSERDDWLPMLLVSRHRQAQRQELFWVYAGPTLAVVWLLALLRAIG